MARRNALWWWIDRWRKSTAYTDMTLEEQGAYRNLLDEATLRGGALPTDERILAKASGDALAWSRVRDAVMARFTLSAEGWRNETLDSVLHQAERRSEKQRRYRNGEGNREGNENGNEHSNATRPLLGTGTVSDHDLDPVTASSAALELAPGTPHRSRFERFWLAFPRKVGKDAAWREWQRLKPSEALTDTMIAAVQAQIASPQWLKDGGQFIPHPRTWLHQGRWEDEPVVSAPVQSSGIPSAEETRQRLAAIKARAAQ